MSGDSYLEAAEDLRDNADQWPAYESSGNCVVLAGPGSGKTKVLTTKLARLLAEDVRKPARVACITYNNACVGELRSRLRKLGVADDERLLLSTVHSFFLVMMETGLPRADSKGGTMAMLGVIRYFTGLADSVQLIEHRKSTKGVTGKRSRSSSPRKPWSSLRLPNQPTLEPAKNSGFTESVVGVPFTFDCIGPSSCAWGRLPGEFGKVLFATTDGGTASPPPDGVARPATVVRVDLPPASA